jgi:DNA-binding XRE family transcriptional regulator
VCAFSSIILERRCHVDQNKNIELRIETDAEWLLLARKKLGKTQKEMSQITGFSTVSLSKMENGLANVPHSLLNRVSKLLKDDGYIDG